MQTGYAPDVSRLAILLARLTKMKLLLVTACTAAALAYTGSVFFWSKSVIQLSAAMKRPTAFLASGEAYSHQTTYEFSIPLR